jgi:hypothetical protein
MVEAIKAIAASAGAVCYADPFLASRDDTLSGRVLSRAKGWLIAPSSRSARALPLDPYRDQELTDPGF